MVISPDDHWGQLRACQCTAENQPLKGKQATGAGSKGCSQTQVTGSGGAKSLGRQIDRQVGRQGLALENV